MPTYDSLQVRPIPLDPCISYLIKTQNYPSHINLSPQTPASLGFENFSLGPSTCDDITAAPFLYLISIVGRFPNELLSLEGVCPEVCVSVMRVIRAVDPLVELIVNVISPV